MSTHARPLAEALAARSDEELVDLLVRRGVHPDAAWNDFFDAAEALLDPSSIARALPRLPRAEAEALLAPGDADPDAVRALTGLALLGPDGAPYPPVAAALAAREPAAMAPATATDTDARRSEQAEARAAERAFTAIAVLADVLLLAEEAPFALLASGAVGMAEKRRAAERGLPDDPALLDDLFAVAVDAGLLRAQDRTLRITEAGDAWLPLPQTARWARTAEGFRAALPDGLRTPSGGWIPADEWPGAYPWDASWPERADDLIRRAGLLGLLSDGAPTPWAAALADGGEAAPDALAPHVPSEVDRIFLQNDLTAISPGPLRPALDLRLRRIAVRESASQASSYRFTADSLAAALSAGETEEGVAAFLDTLSLTGVPQPLRYLLAQSAQRHGLVRVSSDPTTGRTLVRSADPTLLGAIAVDQALRPLGLIREDDTLATRVGRETVFWALTDEHYPAALVDPRGRAETAVRVPPLPALDAPDPAADYAALIARLRTARGTDADAAWLDRELEHAAKVRAVLAVEVAMPDGSSRELVLEVTGLGGGRLRGRDVAGDIERTLPIRSILSTRLVEEPGDSRSARATPAG